MRACSWGGGSSEGPRCGEEVWGGMGGGLGGMEGSTLGLLLCKAVEKAVETVAGPSLAVKALDTTIRARGRVRSMPEYWLPCCQSMPHPME